MDTPERRIYEASSFVGNSDQLKTRGLAEPIGNVWSMCKAWLSSCHVPTVAIILIMLLAGSFRLSSLGHNSLSHGEARRYLEMANDNIDDLRWFPPLQVPMLKLTLAVGGTNETVLRLPSAIAGIACVAVVFLVVRRLFDQWSALGAACIVAGHEMLIEQSRLAKEFSYEAVFAVLVIWAGVEVCRELSKRRLLIFGGVSALAISMTYSAPLLICSFMPLIVLAALRSEQPRVHMKFVAVVFLAIIVLIVGWYVWLTGCPLRIGVNETYGSAPWYAWPESYTPSGLASWFAHVSGGTVRFGLGILQMSAPIKWVVGTLELVAIVSAFGLLWKRCRSLCYALAILAVGTTVAGALQLWPIGAIHTMMFIVPVFGILIGLGAKQIVKRHGLTPVTALVVAVCLLVPIARAGKHAMAGPEELELTRPVLYHILADANPGDGVFVYYPVDSAFNFYWPRLLDEVGRDASELPVLVQPRSDRDKFDLFSERFASFAAENKRVWFVFTHGWGDEQDRWIGHLKSEYTLLDEFISADASAHLVAVGR